MEGTSITAIWTLLLAVASAVVLLANAVEKIVKAVKVAKAPNLKQDERLDSLELWRKEVDRKFLDEEDRLDAIDTGTRVTQRALIALLDHGIEGNNIPQMQHAKAELQEHLISR